MCSCGGLSASEVSGIHKQGPRTGRMRVACAGLTGNNKGRGDGGSGPRRRGEESADEPRDHPTPCAPAECQQHSPFTSDKPQTQHPTTQPIVSVFLPIHVRYLRGARAPRSHHPGGPFSERCWKHTHTNTRSRVHRDAAAPGLASIRLPRKVLVSHTLSPRPTPAR